MVGGRIGNRGPNERWFVGLMSDSDFGRTSDRISHSGMPLFSSTARPVNPNGIRSFSPGLARNAGLPWDTRPTRRPNPERVESNHRVPHRRPVSQSLAKILVHTVFSTKDRRPFLRDKPLRDELHHYLGGMRMLQFRGQRGGREDLGFSCFGFRSPQATCNPARCGAAGGCRRLPRIRRWRRGLRPVWRRCGDGPARF